MVGKLLADRTINVEVVKNTIARIWKIDKPPIFKSIGSNTYVITFEWEADKFKDLEGGPWLFNQRLLILKHLEGHTQPEAYQFSSECFWIQVYNLPIFCMNRQCGEKKESSLEKVWEVEVDTNNMRWGSYLL